MSTGEDKEEVATSWSMLTMWDESGVEGEATGFSSSMISSLRFLLLLSDIWAKMFSEERRWVSMREMSWSWMGLSRIEGDG